MCTCLKVCVHWTHFPHIFPTFVVTTSCWKNVGKMLLVYTGQMLNKCCKKNWRVIYVGRMLGKMLLVCTGENEFYNIFPTFLQHLVTSCDQFEVIWFNGQNSSNALTPLFRRLSWNEKQNKNHFLIVFSLYPKINKNIAPVITNMFI